MPITIKRCGMTDWANSNPNRADRGVDGAGYGYAEMLMARKQMIGAATEFARGLSTSMPANWPDLPTFFYDLSVAQHMGAKALYLYLFEALPYDGPWFSRNRMVHDSRMLEWMGLWNLLVKLHANEVAAHKPLVYTAWPQADATWVGKPERGCVRKTNDALGLAATKAPNGIWILPVLDPFAPAPLTVVSLEDDPAVKFYAREFERFVNSKSGRERKIVFLGLRRNLGALSIDRFFTPETFTIGKDICQALKPTPKSEILHKDDKGRVWALREGNLQIVARRPRKTRNLKSMVKYIDVPEAPDTPAASAENYLKKLMDVTPLSVSGGKFKGVAFEEHGKPVIVLHATSRKGGETLELVVPPDKTVQATIPAQDSKTVEVKGPGKIALSFPPGPGDDQVKGPGLGAVTLVGLNPSELQITGHTLDSRQLTDAVVLEKRAVPAGMKLPEFVMPPREDFKLIDHVKAYAGLEEALVRYNQPVLAECEVFAGRWITNAPEKLLPSFCLLLGNTRMLRGDAEGARDFYVKGLRHAPKDAALNLGLGVALVALGDKPGAENAFRRAAAGKGPAAETARRNLADLKN